MLTIDFLKEYGADVESGLLRCMGSEEFYLMMIGKALEDTNYSVLREKIEAKDYAGAFEAAHALKGVLGNLSLTPMYTPMCEITELLRAGTDTDYEPLLKDLYSKKAILDIESEKAL